YCFLRLVKRSIIGKHGIRFPGIMAKRGARLANLFRVIRVAVGRSGINQLFSRMEPGWHLHQMKTTVYGTLLWTAVKTREKPGPLHRFFLWIEIQLLKKA